MARYFPAVPRPDADFGATVRFERVGVALATVVASAGGEGRHCGLVDRIASRVATVALDLGN
jgi:hypothetical protein